MAQTGEQSMLPSGAGVNYLAPGTPVLCDGARVGIGAIVSVGTKPHIITCGHAITNPSSSLTTIHGDIEVATLRADYFHSADRIDAAVYLVTRDGLALMKSGVAAPTWCDDFHEPQAADNNSEVTFWPTWNGSSPPFLEDVSSYSACLPTGIGCGYVMLTRCTNIGDSGSSLQIKGSYYALASLRDGNNSFFTPLSYVKRRLEATNTLVAPWRPQ